MTAAAHTLGSGPGTYALVYRCPAPATLAAGALGTISLFAGYWVYVGSAFGPGGVRARIGHHLGPSPRPHWHLDYAKCAMTALEIWFTTDPVKREHDWAAMLQSYHRAVCPIPGFGASDCACTSHLIHLRRRPGFNGFRRRIRLAVRSHGPLFRSHPEIAT